MGYYVQALIGKQQTLDQAASQFQRARVVPLAYGMAMIPVTDGLYDEIGSGGDVDRFFKLSRGLEGWALRISASAPVAYIEAEYFGGIGGASAVAWSNGSRVLGPVHAPDAINQALRYFGVPSTGTRDEFETIGLGRYRDTGDWVTGDQL